MPTLADQILKWVRRGYSEAQAQTIVAWLLRRRRERQRLPRMSVGTSAEKRNIPRFAREIAKRDVKRFHSYRPLNIPKLVLASQFKEQPLLDGIQPRRRSLWTPVMQRKYEGEVTLEKFSFAHFPVETMEALQNILAVECTQMRSRLHFDDPRCMDIGPYLLLQAMRQHMSPVFTGGRISPAISKVIDAVGIRSALQMAPFRQLKDHDGVWPFPLKHRRAKGGGGRRYVGPQTKEIVADRLVATVNDWLALVADQQLSRGGRRLVLKIVGEVLDNAERHSKPDSEIDGDWATAGCLIYDDADEQPNFKCHIAFLSLGQTVAESIQTGPPATVARMGEYVRRHRSRTLSEEALQTIFAIQDGVTKSHNAAAEGRGGTGFQDIFQFFADLGATTAEEYQARLSVVSGSTCISLRSPYLQGSRKGDLQTERELWFNSSNEPSRPPDSGHVYHLPGRLNGTLVTMVIDLDIKYLEETANAHS